MNNTAVTQPTKITNSFAPAQGLLQRKCACGNHTAAGGECEECKKKKTGLQRKLSIGANNDPLEHEADRVAEQVMSTPLNSTVNATPPRIQRFSGQASEGANTAPASVDRVLAGSGRPLEPALQLDMGQRFGHDFSQVRVHTGDAAEQSARDVNAHAYTVGNNVVFGAGRFAPGSHKGQRLLAHELAHVVQQNWNNRNLQRQATTNTPIKEHGDINQVPTDVSASCNIAETSPPDEQRINYASDSFSLNVATRNILDDFARRWNEDGTNKNVRIDGYASTTGAEDHNWRLSCSRANSVKQELMYPSNGGVGIPETSLTIYAHGETNRFSQSEYLPNQTATITSEMKINPTPPSLPPVNPPNYDPVPGENVCDDSTYCTPYSSPTEISSAKSDMLTRIPILEGWFGADVGTLWRAYLGRKPGDSLVPRIFDTPGNSIYEAFNTNNYIEDEVVNVLDLVASRLSRGYGNVTQPLDNFVDPPEKTLSTDFANPLTIPGHIAGGIGSSDAGIDYRRITWGTISFDITELPFGKRIVAIEAYVNFEVKDAIDFCPGQCGSPAEQWLATIKMSRLEASGEAYDVPFIVRFPGPRKTKTVIV